MGVSVMFTCVQLDENGIVIGASQLSAEVIAPNIIPVDEPDQYLGMKYENGEFISMPKLEEKETMSLEEKIDLLGQMVVELYLKDGEV
jgi:hypothetical protein